MLVKPIAIVACFIVSPLVLVAATQDPELRRTFALDEARGIVQELRQDLGSLRTTLTEAEARAAAAEAKVAALEEQLDEGLDLLVTTACEAECDCSPSRNLITHFEWLHTRGHEAHAERILDRVCRTLRNDPDRLNRLAWSLMTEDETAGKYDATALALANRMQRGDRRLDHRQLDTLALARFLSGDLESAVELQGQALTQDDRSEYRRRLRTYQAALAVARAPRPDMLVDEDELEIIEDVEQEAVTEATWASAAADENE